MENKKMWRVGNKELDYIKEVINSGLHGTMNTRLEKEFAKKFRTKFAIGVNSGTSALHCCLSAVGIKPGDEVIVTPLTFISPAFAVLYLGAVPVFADVHPETFTIDPKDIERKISKRTKAIIPVSLYGLPADMDPIMRLAKENNLYVIEDNAQCCLGKYQGRLAGTFGHMSIFSFERSKHMTTGNGGMIITNSEELAENARKFSILGYATLTASQISYKDSKDKIQQPDFERHQFIGYNYRLPEVCAAMALAQLEKLDMLVEKRKKIARLYEAAVGKCKWLIPQRVPREFVHSYWTYTLKLDSSKSKVSWMDFRRMFLAEGGERYYSAWKVNYLEPAFKELRFKNNNIEYKKGLCPIAEDLQPKLIQLKTNFGNIEYARHQADILRRTIHKLSS